jgi:hypothetical protein
MSLIGRAGRLPNQLRAACATGHGQQVARGTQGIACPFSLAGGTPAATPFEELKLLAMWRCAPLTTNGRRPLSEDIYVLDRQAEAPPNQLHAITHIKSCCYGSAFVIQPSAWYNSSRLHLL